MRLIRIVAFMMVVHLVLGQQASPGGYYRTRYDSLDVENILNQKRLVHYYAECLLDRGPCTPQGVEFKRILPEALKTNCERCTERQRIVTLETIRRLQKEYPDVWQQLSDSWDPTGEYVRKFEKGSSSQSFFPSLNTVNTIPENVEPSSTNLKNTIEKKVSKNEAHSTAPVKQVTSNIANKPLGFSSTSSPPPPPLPPPVLLSRFGEENERQDKVLNSNIDPSTTTTKIIRTRATLSPVINTLATSTTTKNQRVAKPTTNWMVQDRPTTTRIFYNYDFGVTLRPLINNANATTSGINVVIEGVNSIIQPISDIAGRVITAGTNFAGVVLNALGVRQT